MSRLQKGIIFGLATGLLGMILNQLPLGLWFEEDLGLSLLFTIRGERTPPSDVVVITIDDEASQHLNQPKEPEKWDRSFPDKVVKLCRLSSQLFTDE